MPTRPSLVCGIDVGSLRTLSYIAWLDRQRFVLDLYIPSIAQPLPLPPPGYDRPLYIGFDVPQGLPASGNRRRVADVEANTPTRVLPADREQMRTSLLYKGLIEAGVEIFWTAYEQRLATIAGLPAATPPTTTIFETYPRFLIKTLWPGMPIPSKTRAPLDYVNLIWDQIQAAGYSCASVLRPAVDHVDAMLCALAAEAHIMRGGDLSGAVGIPPTIDHEARVIREGYIVGV